MTGDTQQTRPTPQATRSPQDPVPRARGLRRQRMGTRAAGLLLALALLGFVALLSIWVGTKDIPFTATWQVLFGSDGAGGWAGTADATVIHAYRIPRTLLGMLVGASLGLSGALMQALTRNPLADPGLLGVSMGASTGVVLAIAFLGVGSVLGYVWFAFAGAAVASTVVYVLGSSGRSSATPDRLVLAGAALTAVLYAFNTGILLLDPEAFDAFRFWNVGSLAGRYTSVLLLVLPFIGAGILLAFGLMRPLNTLAMGEQVAGALGARVTATRVVGAVAITLLCGAATAAAGPIAFLGLAVPHVARLIVGPDQRWVLPYSAVLAATLLVGSDVLGRVLDPPAEIQVGIVTALLGGPVFLLLCRRRRLAAP